MSDVEMTWSDFVVAIGRFYIQRYMQQRRILHSSSQSSLSMERRCPKQYRRFVLESHHTEKRRPGNGCLRVRSLCLHRHRRHFLKNEHAQKEVQNFREDGWSDAKVVTQGVVGELSVSVR